MRKRVLPSRKRVLPSIVAGLSICGVLSAAPPDARPTVRIAFVVEAAGIRANLAGQAASCVADVQNGVRADLQSRFPYFEWVTSAPATHTLTLTLKERPTSLDIEHTLTYTASISSGEPPTHVIYEVEDPPGDDAIPLKTDIVKRVREDVARSETELKRYFTTHVPLVKRVEVENRSILLPVTDVHPVSASFLVDFHDAALKRGTIQLVRPQDQPAGVYCEIAAFQFLPLIPRTTWHDQIPAVLGSTQNVEVKVQDFTPRPFTNTSGGVVTTLTGGTR